MLERINASIAEQIERSGEVFLSTGRVRGRFVLRLCILNYSTTHTEVDRALELAAALAVDSTATPTVTLESYPALERGWLRRPSLDTDALRSLALFASLDVEQAERVLLSGREHHAVVGEAIVEQWQFSRDLHIVLQGRVEVTVDGRGVRTLSDGEFFGELSAIDWGAGFARTRSATVTAVEPTRLLVLDWVLVNWLMKADSTFGEELERVSRERLAVH